MQSGFETEIIRVVTEQLIERQKALIAAPTHGFRGSLHPALTMLVMPSSRQYHVVHCQKALLSFVNDDSAPLASYDADPSISDVDVRSITEKVFQCFLAAEAYDQTVQLRRQLRETIVDILQFQPTTSTATVAVKPEVLASTGEPYSEMNNHGGIPLDVWQRIGSFLPASDLLRLPNVGTILFSCRSIVVWWNLYERCFGRFTPQQLRLVRRDITEDDDWPEWNAAAAESELATTAAPLAKENESASVPEEPNPDHVLDSVFELDHRSSFFEAIWPHLLAHKRDSASGLRLSVDGFFEGIAPRGAISLGKRRLLLVNASPLHLLTIQRVGGDVRAVEVLTEDLNTGRATIQFISIAVAVLNGSQRDRSAPSHILAITPEMRHAIKATASQFSREALKYYDNGDAALAQP
ncbi:Hypothetical protein, putative [Bodo saltans]|uniref:F-box domain-containing protein n=1 Tax=Bodo saltans TaxID=75058 RepID=A0A0S4J3W5_BODSA|nr:Hypothetical protein, putative [Bodo saltans]|eukprot:CUG72843.1 Hypothetical protein, putative [Bodo saltans]